MLKFLLHLNIFGHISRTYFLTVREIDSERKNVFLKKVVLPFTFCILFHWTSGDQFTSLRMTNEWPHICITRMYNTSSVELQPKMSYRCSLSTRVKKRMASLALFLLSHWIQTLWTSCLWGLLENISLSMNDQLIFVFIKGLLSAGPNYRGLGTTLVRSTFTAPQENPGCLYNKIWYNII